MATKKTSEETVIEMRKPYAVWTVKDEDYHLKLTTATVIDLEEQYGKNLLDLLGDGMPPLKQMLDITHKALQKYHHGIRRADVNDMFDDYLENGGSQMEFFSTVYIDTFTVSGFFSEKMAAEMRKSMEEAAKEL